MLFCAVTYGGCGGSSNLASVDSGESQVQPEDSGTSTDPADGRGGSGGTSGTIVNLETLKAAYSAKTNDILTGTLGSNVKVSIASGANVTLRDVTINGVDAANYTWAGITCEGSATITLEGINTVTGFRYYYPGISVPVNSTLTITGEGSLTASSNSSANTAMGAGIGGVYQNPSGNIIIEGGTITATGGYGCAGIGSAYQAGKSGNITIRSGDITATGGQYGAGIGSGRQSTSGTIIIGGGTITAEGGENGAGIGSGMQGTSGNITMRGGTITAEGGNFAAAIGGGRASTCGTINITTRVTKITATKGTSADNSIGAGNEGSCGTVTVMGAAGAITTSPYKYPGPVDLSKLTANYTAHNESILTGKLSASVKISIADKATVTLKDATIEGTDDAAYSWAGINCLGDATLILEGANKVTSFYQNYPGINVPEGKTLTIKGDGSQVSFGGGNAAGIGGGNNIPCGNIVIDRGTVTATCIENISGNGTGIGSGSGSSCGNITINDGTVTATGARYGAGIGSSLGGTCGNITINRGIVNAIGGKYGAGIGTSIQSGRCGDITISDEVFELSAIKGSDAINSVGGYDDSSCGTITIGGKKTGAISESPFMY